jgi:hypothetical protein
MIWKLASLACAIALMFAHAPEGVRAIAYGLSARPS